MFVDTHCHLHDTEFYPDGREDAYHQAREAGVVMLCVGTDTRSSLEAVEFARSHEGCYAIIGIHPHEAKDNNANDIRAILEKSTDKIVGIGEIGLDYFYDHSPQSVQRDRLRDQLQIAQDYELPVSFHVREAFDDFWPIFDQYSGVGGVLHSFTDSQYNLDQGYKRGLYVGVNGISTFTKDTAQQQMYSEIPLEKMLLETDAPFLTPKPFRGKVNVPAYVSRVAEHYALVRGVSLELVASTTTTNANRLYRLPN